VRVDLDPGGGGLVESLPFEVFEERVKEGLIEPEVLVRCPPFTGDAFLPVGTLSFYRQLCTSDPVRLRRHLASRGAPLLTAALVGLLLALFAWGLHGEVGTWMRLHLSAWGWPLLEGREAWRLPGAGLIHGSLTHLLGNLVFLAWAGWSLERMLGRRNLLCLYVCASIWTALASALLAPETPVLGSSGAAFAFVAACVVIGWKHRDGVPPGAAARYGDAMVPWLAFPLLLGFTSLQVHSWGHIAGLVVGALLGSLLHPVPLPRHHHADARLRLLLYALNVALLGLCAGAGPALAAYLRGMG
jgi:membrane associated rhomboid family serine protease